MAIGAKKTCAMIEYLTKAGESKIVATCTYPLTGIACVSRIYTDLAVLDVTPDGLKLVDSVPGLAFDTLQAMTAVTLLR